MTTSAIFSPLDTVAKKVGRRWWVSVVVGVAWIIVGFIVLRFDSSTVGVVSVVFGFMVLAAAASEILKAATSPGGWRVWHSIFALLLVLGAIGVFVNPGATFISLAMIVGVYFMLAGTVDIISSLYAPRTSGWWVQLVTGIAEVILGLLASSSIASSIFILVTSISIVAVLRGISEIAAGFALRELNAIAHESSSSA